MELTTVWFIAVAVLWIGYFVLEGFDFGVGMTLPLLGRTGRERGTVLQTIGPVWDGNEVWVIVATGAMFAAFPDWYATFTSGFYLPLLIILAALIIRGVGLEFRGKHDDPQWRSRWELCITLGSVIAAFGWGVVFANLVRGVAIDAGGDYTGSFAGLFSPFALLGGLTAVLIFGLHGAVFVSLKTAGRLHHRSARLARKLGWAAITSLAGWLIWLALGPSIPRLGWVTSTAAIIAVLVALISNQRDREGWAFLGTAAAVALLFATVFIKLYQALVPSTLDPAWSLTLHNASATHYTLTIMTWAAAFGLPLVLLYQGWTYWVFRKRLNADPVGS